MMIRLVLALAMVMAFGAAASAEPAAGAPRLKELVSVSSEIVRIGDLVENAGAAADVPVFRAPDLGQTGAVPVAKIAEALRPYDVTGVDTGGLTEVVVTRLSRALTHKDITERIARAFAGQYGLGDAQNIGVILDREIRVLHVEPTVTGDLDGVADVRGSAHRPLRHQLRAAGQRHGAALEPALHRLGDGNRRGGDADAVAPAGRRHQGLRRRGRAAAEDRVAQRRHFPRPGGRHGGEVAAPQRPGVARRRSDPAADRAAQRGRHHHLRGARHHAHRARQGGRSRRPGRRGRRAQHPVQPHRASHRHRTRPRQHRRRRAPSSPPPPPQPTPISPPSERPNHAFVASCRCHQCRACVNAARRLRVPRSRQYDRGAAAARGDREPDHPTRLQARPYADAGAATRLLQPELAVAERLAGVLQGPARASGRRHPDRHRQPQRQGGDRQRDPAEPREQGRLRRRRLLRQEQAAADRTRRCRAASSPRIPARRATARAR